MAWIVLRGIVAAAVAGLFGTQLTQKGYEGAELLLPLVFALIILSVVLHRLGVMVWQLNYKKLNSSDVN